MSAIQLYQKSWQSNLKEHQSSITGQTVSHSLSHSFTEAFKQLSKMQPSILLAKRSEIPLTPGCMKKEKTYTSITRYCKTSSMYDEKPLQKPGELLSILVRYLTILTVRSSNHSCKP